MGRQRNPETGELMIQGVAALVSQRTGVVTYRGRVTFNDGGGRRRFESRVFKTYDAAVDWKLETELKIRRGTWKPDSARTVADCWEDWHMRRARAWSDATRAQKEDGWRLHIAPEIGAMRISRVGRSDLQRLIDVLERKTVTEGKRTGQPLLGPGSIRKVMSVVTGLFRYALQEGIIDRNPSQGLALPAVEESHPEVWSPLQVRRFLAGIRETDNFPLWMFVATTGCRIGEALALRVGDVRIDEGMPSVWIHRTYRRVRGKATYDEGTKGSRQGHTIRIEPFTSDMLRPLVEGRESMAFVFTRDGRAPHTAESARHRLDLEIARIGLSRITPHGFRHAAATMMIANRVPHNIVGNILGHRNVLTTLNTYAHVGPDEQRIGTGTMSELLGGAGIRFPESERKEKSNDGAGNGYN